MERRALRRFQRNRGAVVGLVIVAGLLAFAAIGPLLAGHDPNTSDFAAARDGLGGPGGPSRAHPLGLDPLFRDLASRLAHGARVSLLVGLVATAVSVSVGAVVGMVSGWAADGRAGFVDSALMRLVDVGLSFPYLLLVMAIGTALGDVTIVTILLVLGLTSWFGTARIVRSKTLQVRSLDFVVASRALGQPSWAVLLRHVLPNVAGPLIVIASASVAQMIIAESVLAYLQVGLPPPTATWGRMLQEGQRYYTVAPRLAVAPGLCIFLGVLGFNLLGEGVRDALDPKET
ncbi:MAG: ABC transporter permease [Polyangiaceae bacterium]|nr:ABC transporter permease [Polyangiaceae bacterium]